MSTLAELRTMVRDHVDDSTATVSESLSRFSNAEIDRYITQAERKYYRTIVESYEDFFTISSTFSAGPSTLTGSRQIYKQPADCDKMRFIHSNDDPPKIYAPAELDDKGVLDAIGSTIWSLFNNYAIQDEHFSVMGDNFLFTPELGEDITGRLYYTKRPTWMSSSSDEPWGGHDNLRSHHDIIAIRAAITAKAKLEADTGDLRLDEREAKQDLITFVEERVTHHKTVRTVEWD